MPRAGDSIGPYTLVKRLGQGSFGVVWLAEKRSAIASTEFALKIPMDESLELETIRREALVWKKAAGHPNILPIIEADVYDGTVAIVSEYVPEGSLENQLQRSGGRAPDFKIAARWMDGILAGLEHLHGKGIVHRDLKPENILMQGGLPRITDFGLSRVLKSSTHSGTVSGTLHYMSPEAFEGERTASSDLWAAGVILYRMVSGNFPFPFDDMARLMKAILMKPPEPLPRDVPEALRSAIEKALEKDPAKRFQHAGAMREALTRPGASHPAASPSIIANPSVAARSLSVGIENLLIAFVPIPAGSFNMGSDLRWATRFEQPVHRVTISKPFELQTTEVTQAQWKAVMGGNPSDFKGDDLPVERVSWNDVQEFLRKLNQLESGKGYRLPTEAEWEYACRAGTTGDRYGDIDAVAWYDKNSGGGTHTVGKKKPNAWGFYDMLGNVWEWCMDWYDDYPSVDVTDPTGPSSGSGRVDRGGGWYNIAQGCRAAFRSGYDPGSRGNYLGFRLARDSAR